MFNPIFFNSGIPLINPGNTNLVAYYNLDSNTNDQTGLSPNGTPTGIDYVAGKTGNAARFDAGTDKILVADSNNFSFTSGGGADIPFSISFWVYIVAYNTTGNWIISKRDVYNISLLDEWQIAVSGKQLYFMKLSDLTNYQGVFTTSQLLENKWYFVTVTDNGTKTNSGMKISVQGNNMGVSNYNLGTYTGMINTTCPLSIGTLYDSAVPHTDTTHFGYIEDIGVWKNRVLTQFEIAYLYRKQPLKTYPF